MRLEKMLAGGDLRSIGQSKSVLERIKAEEDFDELFSYLFHEDRRVVMRAADAVEKVSINHPEYLTKYRTDILELCNSAENKELKWHLALLLPRLQPTGKEFTKAWNLLASWVRDQSNSKIVRVNSLQALFELMKQQKELTAEFTSTLQELEKEDIPSINARIKNLRRQIK